MPMYNYCCTACEAEFELLRSLSDDSAPACPDCGSPEVRRLLSRVVATGDSAKLIKGARSLAKKEGHFSNYSKSERKKGGV
ncbi:zinc ribbon domain-containing protein [Rhodovulum sp. BSW8]|uniref:Putative FmdB family regulatory protein n=1 Tax=Rhodovulum visakhapatnamense TaxID=364297 RepID=A0A4R8FYJ9_9RHOB|nr:MULTISPECIES: zinc ribbon domain-containing protein [Rhodovulum]RBO51787.1 zinc ribbon domain-containing protein [Rhodovulum sp. BSW8]TDX30700.1 putative FmdB family regulatory protein [Rhodovulum visakhapatnamense]